MRESFERRCCHHAKDKGKATEATEKKAQTSEKARVVVEKRLTDMDVKLGELKLAKAKSLKLAQADEITDLKAVLESCE